MKYAKLVDDKPVYAGNVIRMDGAVVVRPGEVQLRAAGFKPVIDTPPDPLEGKIVRASGWSETADAIVRTYVQEDAPPPPPRTFSKLRIVVALTKAGVWEQVKSYIEQAGLYDLYLAAQDFAEDNEYFTQGKTALQTALGWTDEQVEAVLQEAAE